MVAPAARNILRAAEADENVKVHDEDSEKSYMLGTGLMDCF